MEVGRAWKVDPGTVGLMIAARLQDRQDASRISAKA